MRNAEQSAIEAGTAASTLMERAGKAVADWAARLANGGPVTILCGPGNNGGDGYVAARLLAERGLTVRVVQAKPPASETACAAAERIPASLVASSVPTSGAVLVDCLFGTGLSRPVGDADAGMLANLARTHDLAMAVDLPSGVDADTGVLLTDELPKYALTLALGAWKRAHWLMPATAKMGAKRLADLGIAQPSDAPQLIERPTLRCPSADAHKYSRGLVAVVGGAMAGAGVLAARAAMHSGAGYVKLLSGHSHPAVPAALVVDDTPSERALEDDRIDVVLIGPGLGRDKKAKRVLAEVLARECPTVLDADALHLLSPGAISERSAPLIVTPHEGELAALCNAMGIEAEGKVDRVLALADRGLVVVAKGPDTIVAAPDGKLAFSKPAPSWLSTAGTGDVLAGILASRVAAGDAPFEAACHAVWLHGEAARMAGPAFRSDTLAECLPAALSQCL